MKAKHAIVVIALFFLMQQQASAYVADYMSILWNASIKETMSGMDVADINGDNSLEILVSSSSEGIIYAFGPTGEVIWKYGVPGYVNFVRAVDLNGDGMSEVITGSSSHLYVVNSSGTLLWKYYTEGNSVETADALDVNDDGMKDVIFGADKGSCGGNILYALNSANAESIWIYNCEFYYPYVIRPVVIDGQDIILVGTFLSPRSMAGCVPLESKPARLLALDNSGNLLWTFNTSGGVKSIATGDIDDDGSIEIAIAASPNVYVLSPDGDLKWQEDLEDRVDGVALAPNRDNTMEVLAATYKSYAIDPTGTRYSRLNTTDRGYSVAAADLNNDMDPEYVVGSDKLYVFDSSKSIVWNSSKLTFVGYLFIGNFDNLPDKEVVAGADKRVLVFKTGIRAKVQEADAYYNRAQQLYSSGQYTTALNYATQARDIYSRFQQDDGLRKTRALMDLIGTKVNSSFVIGREADEYYNLSLNFYGSMDFINASVNAQIAKSKYDSIGNVNGSMASELVLNNSRDFLMRNASSSSMLATDAYEQKDFDLALEQAQQARDIYLFLRNSTAASYMDDLIVDINQVRKPPLRDRIRELLERPEIKKYVYPSEYDAVNMTIWMIYLILAGLVLVGISMVFARLYSRLRRKTLDLNALAPQEKTETTAEKVKPKGEESYARNAVLFFLAITIAILLFFAYLLAR